MARMLSVARGLNADEIRAILPHRHPFRMLDRITDLDPGRRGVAWKNISVAEPCFAGHFPQTSIFPGVLILEALAQLAGVVHGTGAAGGNGSNGNGSNGNSAPSPRIGYLAAVRNIKFVRLVRPGDRLVLTATMGTTFGNLVDFSVDATVDGEVAASGRLAIADPAQEIS